MDNEHLEDFAWHAMGKTLVAIMAEAMEKGIAIFSTKDSEVFMRQVELSTADIFILLSEDEIVKKVFLKNTNT